jgi:DNA-binding response OmpR family regulator
LAACADKVGVATILVAEDDSGMREWLAEVLQAAAYRVLTAEDGLRARSLANLHSPDLVITDISMPHEEGLGLIRAMRSAHPQTKIIVISGKDPDTLDDAKLLGAHATLQKPIGGHELLQAIRDLLT